MFYLSFLSLFAFLRLFFLFVSFVWLVKLRGQRSDSCMYDAGAVIDMRLRKSSDACARRWSRTSVVQDRNGKVACMQGEAAEVAQGWG
jgi:hypothetical protein